MATKANLPQNDRPAGVPPCGKSKKCPVCLFLDLSVGQKFTLRPLGGFPVSHKETSKYVGIMLPHERAIVTTDGITCYCFDTEIDPKIIPLEEVNPAKKPNKKALHIADTLKDPVGLITDSGYDA